MAKIKDGGPIHPSYEITQFGGIYNITTSGGMSLRDYLADRASEEDIQAHRSIGTVQQARTREQAKYAYADAMLEARKHSYT
jgi:hypothetical protein